MITNPNINFNHYIFNANHNYTPLFYKISHFSKISFVPYCELRNIILKTPIYRNNQYVGCFLNRKPL